MTRVTRHKQIELAVEAAREEEKKKKTQRNEMCVDVCIRVDTQCTPSRSGDTSHSLVSVAVVVNRGDAPPVNK